jgi:5-methyltetrahydrofolate--homocysteine methyltransferase
MIIIGERINASRKPVREALEKRDEDFIMSEIMRQDKAGADYIDLNAGAGLGNVEKEIRDMRWLIDIALRATAKKIAIDSADPRVLQPAAEHIGDRRPWLLNSVKADAHIMQTMLPIAARYGMPLIALAMDGERIAADVHNRIAACAAIFDAAKKAGVSAESIFFDPLVFPLSTESTNAATTLAVLQGLKKRFPDCNAILGLSNVSHGLPKRSVVNASFLCVACCSALDAAICDPTNVQIQRAIILGQLYAGNDRHCRRFSRSVRGGLFD